MPATDMPTRPTSTEVRPSTRPRDIRKIHAETPPGQAASCVDFERPKVGSAAICFPTAFLRESSPAFKGRRLGSAPEGPGYGTQEVEG